MSDEKPKGLAKPDGPGRWIVVRDDTPTQAVIYFEFQDLGGGRLHDVQTNGSAEMWTREGDSWHRCYVPGLDGEKEPQFPGSPVYRSAIAKLDAAGFDEGLLCGIDCLERDRDEAKAAAEQLRESNANLLANFDAQTRQNRTLQAERDEARQEVERLTKERDSLKAKLDAAYNGESYTDLCNDINEFADQVGIPEGGVIWRLERMARTIAELRSQQGKGEGDAGDKLSEYDQLIRDFTQTMIRRWDAAGNFLEDAQALYRMREGVAAAVKEASRAN